MRLLTTVFLLGIGAMTIADSVSAQTLSTSASLLPAHKRAPAPQIGSGVPALVIFGGILLGATLMMRARKS